jgi:hypothetical protein
MLEARGREFQQIVNFNLWGNDFRQSLPGISRALDDFYWFRQRKILMFLI